MHLTCSRSGFAWLLGLILFASTPTAFAQTVSASVGSPVPDPVAVGTVATAILNATSTLPALSPGDSLTGPTWQWSLTGGGGGITINHPNPS